VTTRYIFLHAFFSQIAHTSIISCSGSPEKQSSPVRNTPSRLKALLCSHSDPGLRTSTHEPLVMSLNECVEGACRAVLGVSSHLTPLSQACPWAFGVSYFALHVTITVTGDPVDVLGCSGSRLRVACGQFTRCRMDYIPPGHSASPRMTRSGK
jgi:hypothetical protein